MKPDLHFVDLTKIPILRQLQWEEALLRADDRNWCLINQGSPPAIVLGISGQPDHFIHQEKISRAPLPIIRRFSGGGTVVVEEHTLFITLVCQTEAVSIPSFPKSLMEWSATLYRPLFPGLEFDIRENDYVLGNLKWGGNAQSIRKGRWLHHSSLLWDYTSKYMQYLKIPLRMPSYRNGRSHTDFLCRLRDVWPNAELFKSRFIDELQNHFNLIKVERIELEIIERLPHRKITGLIT